MNSLSTEQLIQELENRNYNISADDLKKLVKRLKETKKSKASAKTNLINKLFDDSDICTKLSRHRHQLVSDSIRVKQNEEDKYGIEFVVDGDRLILVSEYYWNTHRMVDFSDYYCDVGVASVENVKYIYHIYMTEGKNKNCRALDLPDLLRGKMII